MGQLSKTSTFLPAQPSQPAPSMRTGSLEARRGIYGSMLRSHAPLIIINHAGVAGAVVHADKVVFFKAWSEPHASHGAASGTLQ